MRTGHWVRVATALVFLGVVACRSSTAPDEPMTLDDALGELSSIGAYGVPGTMAPSLTAPGFTSSCPWDAGGQRFSCPTVTNGSMSYDRSYQLLDAGGAVLAAWGPDVDAIRTEMNLEGTVSSTSTITGELFSSVVSGHQVSTLGRLHESRHTLKATFNYTTTSTLGAGEPSTLSGGQQTDFILPDRSRGELYPTGTVTLLFTEGGTTTTVATMTYDGTSVVRMTLGGMTCTYDLANRSVAPVCN